MSRSATEQPRKVWCCSTCGAIYHKDFPRCPIDGAEVVIADRDPLLGAMVGHYTIDKLIGEGGMGRVYLAHHANLPNKRYAFKVLLGDHSASTTMRVRFTREAERASQLDHPNVVKVVDFGQTTHGLLYIVMDYVEGASLVSLIGDAPMPPAQVISLARAICKGLVHAHAAGLVHRDLKPENILVCSGPEGLVPRIVDFGLAMSIDQSDARLTESGMTMGTPAFAAPEQLSGKLIDHRADLFALGMTMFEMLTGGLLPFDGPIMEVVSAKTARDAPRISERAPGLAIAPELDELVARLTRRKPADRYASAREVIEALDQVHLGPEARMATEIAEPSFSPPPPSLSRRAWKVAALAAVCGFAAAGSYVVAARPSGTSSEAVVASRVGSSSPPPVAEVPVVAAPAPALAAPAAPAAPAVASEGDPAAPAPAPATADDPAPESARPPAAGAPPVTHHRHRPRAARPPVHAEPAPPAPPVVSEPAPTPPVAVVTDGSRSIAGQGPRDTVAGGNPRGVALPPAPPPPSSPPPPSPPRELQAKIDGVEVNGSLSRGEVQRAIERRWSAIARCMPAAPGTVVAHFTIGEARRARDVRAAGPAPATNACVEAAFADVRTEAAPDVGDVEVTVRIAFVGKT
jgi:serine/threonine protein kinase